MDPAEFCLVNHLYGDASPTLRFCKFCRKAMCEICYNNHIKAFNNGCSFQAANGDTILQNPRVSSFSIQNDNVVPQDISMEPAQSLSDYPVPLVNGKQPHGHSDNIRVIPGMPSLSTQNDNVVPQDINMVPVQSSSDYPVPIINDKQLPGPRDKHLYKQCTTHSLNMDQFCYQHCSVICQQCRYETHQHCSVKDVEQVCLELDHTTVGELRKSLNKIRVDAIEVKTILGRNVSDLEKQKQSMLKKLKKAHEDVLKEASRKYEETKSEIEGQNEKYISELCAYICHINSILDGLNMCLKDTGPLEGRRMEVGVFLKYQDILSSNSQIPSDLQNLYSKIRKVKLSFKENKRFQPLLDKSTIGNINATTTKYNSINPHQEINCPLFVSQPVLIRKSNSIAAASGETTTKYGSLNSQQEVSSPLFVSQPVLMKKGNSVTAETTLKYDSLNPQQEGSSPLFVSQPVMMRKDNSVSLETTTKYTSLKPQQEISSLLFVPQPVEIRRDMPVAASNSLCTRAGRNESGCTVRRETYMYVKAVKDRDLNVRIGNDKDTCSITGLDVTQDGRLLMKDYHNDWDITALDVTQDGRLLMGDSYDGKIKMLTADRQRLLQLQLNQPCDGITVYNETTAVAGGYHSLFFIDISEGNLALKKTVRIDYDIVGIQTCGNNLLVICEDNDEVLSVKLITTAGEPLWSVGQDQTFMSRLYITCYKDQSQCRVVVTDWMKDCITVLDGDTGDVIKVITVEGKCPGGVTADNNGNFYICYNRSEIVIWNRDMTSSRVLVTSCSEPTALGYDSFRNQLIVSDCESDEVECYQLQ